MATKKHKVVGRGFLTGDGSLLPGGKDLLPDGRWRRKGKAEILRHCSRPHASPSSPDTPGFKPNPPGLKGNPDGLAPNPSGYCGNPSGLCGNPSGARTIGDGA